MDIIFKAIVGSQAYGTNVPGSDTDIKGVYIQIESSGLPSHADRGELLKLVTKIRKQFWKKQ